MTKSLGPVPQSHLFQKSLGWSHCFPLGVSSTGPRDAPTVHGQRSQNLAGGQKHRESGILESTEARTEDRLPRALCSLSAKAEPGPQVGACHPNSSQPGHHDPHQSPVFPTLSA